ncbi:alpha/beta hydrolase [Sphaerisporangium fuscum]|uniref:alpha/beta hydrolase n=1 Tax=Sphaerisporangium fuscum TaxID=2835868 RepID=UPI001BDC64FA|nr:hypothetical protein [Sphaerisporangium fuscum]
MTDPQPPALPADHSARRAAGPALWVTTMGAAAFTLFAVVTTQVHAVRAGSPWQDDPYDGVVTFTLFLVPALAGLVAARATLLRRREPQPVFRVAQLLRAALVCTLMIAATVAADWLAVARRADHPLWNDRTPWLIAALVPLTAVAATGLLLQWRALRRLPSGQGRRSEGDWVGDLAPMARPEVLDFARGHVAGITATAAVAAGLLLTTMQAIGEGGFGPLLFLTEAAAFAGGFFAFSMAANAVLRIAVPRGTAAEARGRARRSARAAVTAGAFALPAFLVLREGVLPLLGTGGEIDPPVVLAVIAFAGSLVTTVLVLVLSLIFRRRPGRPRWRVWVGAVLKTVVALVLTLVVVTAGYVGAVAVLHAQPVTLPAPTGAFHVGRTAFDWTDQARTDPVAPRPGLPRRLSVWLWYPAPPDAGGRPAPYAPGAWEGLHFEGPFGLGETRFEAVTGHALQDAPVAAGRFPVVALEPGMGLAAPQYTALAENLASRGYLVVGVTPTYSANLAVLDGKPLHSTDAGNPPELETADIHTGAAAGRGDRLVGLWAADARFALGRVAALDHGGRFAGHVDAARTAYLGHSFGGAASLEACRTDPHCAGAVDLDGTQFGPVVSAGLSRPMLIMSSEDSCVTGTCPATTDAANRDDQGAARALLAAGTGPAWCYRIDGSLHFNFTDYAAYYVAGPLRALLTLGTIDGHLGLGITNAYVGAFLDHTVKGADESLLTAKSSPYRGVRAECLPR